MKVISTLISAALLLTLTACGGNMNTVQPVNYDGAFDDLNQVQQIFRFRLDNWEYINDQTLFVDTDHTRHYLIVLRRPNPYMDREFNLRVTSSDRNVYAGTSRISDDTSPETYIIDAIYEIDRDQRDEIRARILDIAQDA